MSHIVDLLKGKSQVEAIEYLKANKIQYRIVVENHIPYVLTSDFVPDRINLNILYGLVVDVSLG